MKPNRSLMLCALLAACGGGHAASRAPTAPGPTAKPAPVANATPAAKPTPPVVATERQLITEAESPLESRPDVIAGTLVAVGRAPGFWSGGIVAIQELTYQVTHVLRGPPVTGNLTVRYVIVASSNLVAGSPELRPELTRVGDTYLVSLTDVQGFGRIAADVMPATPAQISDLEHRLAAK